METPGITNITLYAFRIFILSRHLQFLLEKFAHSDNILGLDRRKVFIFGYLHQNHSIYVKKTIFALARYIR